MIIDLLRNLFESNDKYLTGKLYIQVLTARLNYTPETKEIAETRFSESDFVIQCLEWHNLYRKIHSAPPLKFDAIVSYPFLIILHGYIWIIILFVKVKNK